MGHSYLNFHLLNPILFATRYGNYRNENLIDHFDPFYPNIVILSLIVCPSIHQSLVLNSLSPLTQSSCRPIPPIFAYQTVS